MANHRAIAIATEVLRRRLSGTIATEFPGVQVSAKRPEATDGQSQSQVTLFLYRVSPNAALRNQDLTTRDSQGRVVRRPTAALDLHYLLTFAGDEQQLAPQRMLGLAVSTLHSRAELSRAEIESASVGGWLGESDLAGDVEKVKLSMSSMTLDDMSKLWSFFFQVPYQLSVGYEASVVMIEADVSTREPLPVETRDVTSVPVRQPVIQSVNGDRPVFGGGALELEISGTNLRGASTFVRIDDAAPQPVGAASDTRLVVPPLVAGDLAAGTHTVRVIHEIPLGTQQVPHRVVESNAATFVLRPTTVVTHARGDTEIGVDFVPTVRDGQHVSLLLNEVASPPPLDRDLRFIEIDAAPTTRPAPWTRRSFDVSAVPAGTYIVRARVDNAETRMMVGDGTGPGAPAHRVTLP